MLFLFGYPHQLEPVLCLAEWHKLICLVDVLKNTDESIKQSIGTQGIRCSKTNFSVPKTEVLPKFL